MTAWRKAILCGVFVWLIPFAVAFGIFPLRESARPLFESIMPVAVAATVVGFGTAYFRLVRRSFVREGLVLGLLWMAISLAIDAPLMLLGGPMHMTPGAYAADIGLTYLLIPTITVGLGIVAARSTPPASSIEPGA